MFDKALNYFTFDNSIGIMIIYFLIFIFKTKPNFFVAERLTNEFLVELIVIIEVYSFT